MFNLNENCCICLYNKHYVRRLYESEGDGIPFYIKLTSSVPEMHFEEISDRNVMCKGCCDILNVVYNFHQKCLQNKVILIDYMSKLNSVNCAETKISKRNDINESVESKRQKDENYDVNELDGCVISCKSNNDENNMLNSNTGKNIQINSAKSALKLQDISVNEQNGGCEDSVILKNIKKEFIDLNIVTKASVTPENINVVDNYEEDREKITINAQDNSNKHYILLNNVKEEVIDLNEDRQTSNMFRNSNEIVDNSNCDEIKIEENEIKVEENWQHERFNGSKDISGLADVACESKSIIKHKETLEDRLNDINEKQPNYILGTVQNSNLQNPRECTTCNKKFSKTGNCKRHMMVHSGEKPFSCELCSKQFTQNESLKRHMRIHLGEKPYECNICKLKCNTTSNLRIHMMNHSNEKPFGCTICGKKFRRNWDLKAHMVAHSGETPFSCNLCDRKYARNWDLKVHMMIHLEEKPFTCKICDKKFVRHHTFKAHMVSHSRKKHLSCQICDVQFTTNKFFKEHMLIHSAQNPFCCEMCNKKFRSYKKLKEHVVIHSG